MQYNYLGEGYFDNISPKNKISIDDTKQSLKSRKNVAAIQKLIHIFDDAVKTNSDIKIINYHSDGHVIYAPVRISLIEPEKRLPYDAYISEYIKHILFFSVTVVGKSLVINDNVIFNCSIDGSEYNFPYDKSDGYTNTITNWHNLFVNHKNHNYIDRFITSEIRENTLCININYFFTLNGRISNSVYNGASSISAESVFNGEIKNKYSYYLEEIRSSGISYDEWIDFLQNGQSFMKVYSAMFIRPELYIPAQQTLRKISDNLSIQPFIENDENGLKSIPVKCAVSFFADNSWNRDIVCPIESFWKESPNPAIKGKNVWLYTITPDKILKNENI